MGFQNSITGGQGALERPAIKSPNFISGSTGWSIARDGSAEFNNITIRNGAVVGGTQLWYNGTPATGNLVFSIAASAGTDTYGNAYPAGFTAFDRTSNVMVNLATGTVFFGPIGQAFAARIGYSIFASGATVLTSGVTNTATEVLISQAFPGVFGGASGTANAAKLQLLANDPSVAADLTLNGNVYQTDGSGNIVGWTAATLSGVTGDSGASMFAGLYTRPLGNGTVALTGNVHSTTNVTSGTVIATGLPPTTTHRVYVPATNNLGGGTGGGGFSNPMLFIDNAGQATYYGATLTTGTELYVSGIYPTYGV